MKKYGQYLKYVAAVFAVIAGIVSGSFSVKASLISERKHAESNTIHLNRNVYSVVVSPKSEQTAEDVVADFSSFGGFWGVYASTSTVDGRAEIGRKSLNTIIAFESAYGKSITENEVREGRGLTAADKADGRKTNVVLGGKNWEKYFVGDQISLTLFYGENALGIDATVVGKISTPFVAGQLNCSTDVMRTYGGVIILPADLTEKLVPNAFENYVIAVDGADNYEALCDYLTTSEKYNIGKLNHYEPSKRTPEFSAKFYLASSIILCIAGALFLISANGKSKIMLSLCYLILGSSTTLLSAFLFKKSVSSQWFTGRVFHNATVCVGVIFAVSMVFLIWGIAEKNRFAQQSKPPSNIDPTNPTI